MMNGWMDKSVEAILVFATCLSRVLLFAKALVTFQHTHYLDDLLYLFLI